MMICDRTPLAVLLTAAGHGDHAAFAEVYDTTSQQVYGATSQRLYDPKQAEARTLKSSWNLTHQPPIRFRRMPSLALDHHLRRTQHTPETGLYRAAT